MKKNVHFAALFPCALITHNAPLSVNPSIAYFEYECKWSALGNTGVK